jgi:hypothetical protein
MSLGQFGLVFWLYLLIHDIDIAFSLFGWHKLIVLVSFPTWKSSVGPVLVEIQVFEVLTGAVPPPGGTVLRPAERSAARRNGPLP